MVKKSDLNEDPPGLGEKVYTRHLWAWWMKNLFIIAQKLSLVHTQMQEQDNTCMSNINTFKCKCKCKCEHTVMACICTCICCVSQGNANARKKNKFHWFHDTMAQWSWKQDCIFHFRWETDKECARKHSVLYDKHCADKLKKTLAWKDVAKKTKPKNHLLR